MNLRIRNIVTVASIAFVLGGVSLGCTAETESDSGAEAASALKTSDAVKLIDAFTADCPPVSGCTTRPQFNATIEVKNLAYEKKVEIVATTGSEPWRTMSARFVRSVGNDRELWAVASDRPVTRFAVSYAVGGRKYWDNNEGNDYSFARYATAAFVRSAALGAPIGSLEGAGTASAAVKGFVFAQPSDNRTPSLGVTYTDDGWKTSKRVDAELSGRYDRLDAWKYSLPVAAVSNPDQVEFAFELQHPRGAVWDNNYELNYRIVDGKISR